MVNGFTVHLYTRLRTTSTYDTVADLHTLQITRAHAKSSQSAFTTRFLVMDPNNADTSASMLASCHKPEGQGLIPDEDSGFIN
jgi:hypothetical protein